MLVSACLMLSERLILKSHFRNSGRLSSLTSHSAQAYSDRIPFMAAIITVYSSDCSAVAASCHVENWETAD